MIFASDLDRTLFYSCKSFEKEAKEKGYDYVYIDVENGHLNKSIMSKEAVKLLSEFSKNNHFIPVTAREERHFFNRVQFEKYNINFDYAILGNGSKIYYKGSLDTEWEKISNECKSNVDLQGLMKVLNDKYGEDNIKSRSFGFEIRTNVDCEELINIVSNFKNIRIGKDHRFCYVLINGITKLDALIYIQNKLRETKDNMIVAGDSFMDIPMIEYVGENGVLSMNGHLELGDEGSMRIIYSGGTVLSEKGVITSERILDTLFNRLNN